MGSGYNSLAENFIKFNELGQLPGTHKLERLNEDHGIEAAMVANNGQYHHTCRLKYSNTKLQRAEQRKLKTEGESHDIPAACKCTRSHSRTSRTENMTQGACLFCGQPVGTDGLHQDISNGQPGAGLCSHS